jgi:hypothetical protein
VTRRPNDPEELADQTTDAILAEMDAAGDEFYRSVQYDRPAKNPIAESADLVEDEADDGDA